MRSIYDILEDACAATPANTMGMGNPIAPSGDNVGSEPINQITIAAKKEKKPKKFKCVRDQITK